LDDPNHQIQLFGCYLVIWGTQITEFGDSVFFGFVPIILKQNWQALLKTEFSKSAPFVNLFVDPFVATCSHVIIPVTL
jgi:hypothetical protein